MVKKIIFGIGTPRSGTQSLTELFKNQRILKIDNTYTLINEYVKHEACNNFTPFFDTLEIESDREVIVNNYLTMVKNNLEKDYYVSYSNKKSLKHYSNSLLKDDEIFFHINVSYFLLEYIDLFIKKDNSIKVIIIKRDREKTIKSIYNRYKFDERLDMFFRIKFKNLNDNNYEEIIGSYYDNYYKLANSLKEKYPENFYSVNLEEIFYDEDKQKQMLNFCGFENPNILMNIHCGKYKYQ